MSSWFHAYTCRWKKPLIDSKDHESKSMIDKINDNSNCNTPWRHQMETFAALLAICAGIHRSPVTSPHKGQWRGALMFSLICVWINGWVNNREAGDLRRYRARYDVIVMNNHNVDNHSNRHTCNGNDNGNNEKSQIYNTDANDNDDDIDIIADEITNDSNNDNNSNVNDNEVHNDMFACKIKTAVRNATAIASIMHNPLNGYIRYTTCTHDDVMMLRK